MTSYIRTTDMLQKLFKRRPNAADRRWALPDGMRVYAIGDIHGRLDLLDSLLMQIEKDDAGRDHAESILVFLGDLIDRGQQSAEVVERLRLLAVDRPTTRFLLGNHEEVFLTALGGDMQALRAFCRIGGRETVMSYGVSAADYEQMDYETLAECISRVVPDAHRQFLKGFEESVVLGDYLFVHAGVRPGTPLSEQRPSDLRWIREPFLKHRGTLDKMVVHGHTIVEEVEFCQHRIGLDTGAYQSGRLSALCLEGDRHWVLQT